MPVAGSGGQQPGSRLISVTLDWNEWAVLKGASTVSPVVSIFLKEDIHQMSIFFKEDIRWMSMFFEGDIRQMSIFSLRNI